MLTRTAELAVALRLPYSVNAVALGAAQHTTFDTLDVQRINIREPDGTPPMVIFNTREFPGGIVKGKEYPHASRTDSAGAIIFDDEVTENGGRTAGLSIIDRPDTPLDVAAWSRVGLR